MKRFITKKTLAIGLVVGLALGAGGAAFAYFTSTGSGNGTATVGTSTNLVLTESGSVTGLTPGGPTDQISVSAQNNGSGYEELSGVTVTVDKNATTGDVTTGEGDTDVTGCLASWFTITPETVTAVDIEGGTSSTISDVATIQLTNDTSASQNACKSAVINLDFTSN